MVSALRDHSAFLTLLLQTPSRKQAFAIINTATPKQIQVLGEIALNLLTLPLTKNAAAEVKRKTRMLKRLSDSTLSIKRKHELLKRHQQDVLDVLYPVTTQLLELLQ